MRTRADGWVALLLTCLLLPACSTTEGDDVQRSEQALEALRARPSLESELARLTDLRDAVAAALGGRVRLTGWEPVGETDQSFCGDDTGDARIAMPPTLRRTGGVPDDRWQQTVEVVAEVAAGAGFGPPETVVDAPGEHEVVLRGTYESLLRFGTLANATLALQTGCHLSESTD